MPPDELSESSAWAALCNHLDILSKTQSHHEHRINATNSLHNAFFSQQNQDNAAIFKNIEDAHVRIKADIVEERRLLSNVADALSVLNLMRVDSDHLSVHDDKRKRRKLSPSASHQNSTASSPVSTSASMARTNSELSNSGRQPSNLSIDTALAAHPSSGSGANTPTPSTGKPSKIKKNSILDQLPLQPGRPVAFRQPNKTGGKVNTNDWIHARVVRCLLNDKNRYEVQDVDVDGHEGKTAPCYNTTLKAIMPLPDPRDRSTYPAQYYPKDTSVLALYPDTTSFYRARVVATPTSSKRPVYKVIFEDDDNDVKPVPADLIVAYSGK